MNAHDLDEERELPCAVCGAPVVFIEASESPATLVYCLTCLMRKAHWHTDEVVVGDIAAVRASERFHGVSAPAWADDSRLAEILRAEAADHRSWVDSDRDKALLLTAADRIELLNSELASALHAIDDQELLQVEIFDLRQALIEIGLTATGRAFEIAQDALEGN